MQLQYKAQNDRLEVVNDGALTLKSYDVGAVKTWVLASQPPIQSGTR